MNRIEIRERVQLPGPFLFLLSSLLSLLAPLYRSTRSHRVERLLEMDTQPTPSNTSSESGECVICGKETSMVCPPCHKAGLKWMYFCSKEHQKLVSNLSLGLVVSFSQKRLTFFSNFFFLDSSRTSSLSTCYVPDSDLESTQASLREESVRVASPRRSRSERSLGIEEPPHGHGRP